MNPGGIRTNFGSSVKLAARHPAYDTPEGSLNQLIGYMSNKSAQETWSDPGTCARVLFEVVVGQQEHSLPRRLLMGGGTIDLVRADLEKSLEEVRVWEGEARRCSPGSDDYRIPGN